MTREKKAVDRLAKEYQRAQNNLDEFVAEYENVFDEYSIRANERNVRLDKLKRKVRETGLSAGPLEVSISRRRVFDGKRLYDMLVDREDIRKALVQIEFKVNTSNFDAMVQAGEISATEAQAAVKEIKATNRVLHTPPDIVVG
jgi:polyhydroxyalkanoate synthesis regulator phasin